MKYKNNDHSLTGGSGKMEVYDWLSNILLPLNQQAFNIIEVKFKGSRKDFYVNPENLFFKQSDMVVVETTGGHDVGHVSLTGELVRLQLKKRNIETGEVIKKIYRKPTSRDVEKWKGAKGMESELMQKARVLARSLGLLLKITDVDVQGDQAKATFYYTAPGRIDFRELIKLMAETFRIRIEMRQINMLEEASRLGGIGTCGREMCFSTWLSDYKMGAKSSTGKNEKEWTEFKCCLIKDQQNNKISSWKANDLTSIITNKGTATLQKTDEAQKIMWYSYPDDKNLIPIKTERVKEIQKLIQEGMVLKDLMEEAAVIIVKPNIAKVLDFVNVVGQDSITRFEEKKKNKKKRKKRIFANTAINPVIRHQ